MSVVIRGMKMPKNCKECPFCQWSNHYQTYVCFNGNRYTEMFFDGKYPTESALRSRRADNCPMTELPAEHGRLIDAYALQQSIKESIDECHKWADEVEGGEMYARVSQSLGTFVECSLRIKAAPTVIEAEVSE